ncbi:MAG: cupin domain-containing protein, partial [Steroidobacteraceae bacterium]
MGRSPQEGSAVRHAADDATSELDILEQTISIEGARALRHDAHGLGPAPIPRAWIREGNPVARKKRLAGSSDHLASTYMWDCTAGRFDWFYDTDEVIHVLEGSVNIEDAAGARKRLQAGDTFLFPAGSRYRWTVPDYIRKVAFLHSPLSREMQ